MQDKTYYIGEGRTEREIRTDFVKRLRTSVIKQITNVGMLILFFVAFFIVSNSILCIWLLYMWS